MSHAKKWISVEELAKRLSPGFLQHYSIGPELGHGGMGVVYRGTDLQLERDVAIKFLQRLLEDETASALVSLKRFWQEGRAAAKVSHPNLARIFDMGQDGVLAYIVFEYVAGEPLAQVIRREQRLPIDRVLAIALQVLRGLEALHAAGVVHRDIKPSNLMMTAQGAKIIDLGIALADDATADITARTHVMGSVNWMAPEQILNTKIGPQADLYAVGEVMYRCLTGELPFTGNPAEVTARKLVIAPAPVRSKCEVPESLAGTIDQLLALDPAARPGSAAETIDRLTQRARLTAGHAVLVNAHPPTEVSAAATASAAASGVAAGGAARPGRSPGEPPRPRHPPSHRLRLSLIWVVVAVTASTIVLGAWLLSH